MSNLQPSSFSLTRRDVIKAILLGVLIPGCGRAKNIGNGLHELAKGLEFPEGIMLDDDGSVILSEILGRRIIRLLSDGTRKTILEITDGGMPCGLAAGPDGALYIANVGSPFVDGKQSYHGRIQRLDPHTKILKDIATHCDGIPFVAPDDLVFDDQGGLYFTDISSIDPSTRILEKTGVYYFDGEKVRRVVSQGFPTNGIDLSPDGKRLYWSEYQTGRLFMREVISSGVLAEPAIPYTDCIYTHPAPITWFDSLRVDSKGYISMAVHNGTGAGKSGIMSFDSNGKPFGFVPMPETRTTCLALSWNGEKYAYVTLSDSGRVVKVPWLRYGQEPRYTLSDSFR